jgi:predicted dehydrogenase
MKLLVVGCGSIGRRHARNARKLGLEVVLCDISEERVCDVAAEIKAVSVYTDYQVAANQSGAEAALIATPSHLHVAPASVMLTAGMHVMMEKPLCPSLKEANELKRLVVESKRVFMMAHTFRFRAEWQAVKKLLDTQPVGRVLSAELLGGWYLPDWHFREDYRQEYAAQRRQGGGVLLTSMSHFFDVVSWFFGDIKDVVGAKMRLSSLDIDVDDAVMCTVSTADGVVRGFSRTVPKADIQGQWRAWISRGRLQPKIFETLGCADQEISTGPRSSSRARRAIQNPRRWCGI